MWKKKKEKKVQADKNDGLLAEATAVPVAVPIKDDHPQPTAPSQPDYPSPLAPPGMNSTAQTVAPLAANNNYQPPPLQQQQQPAQQLLQQPTGNVQPMPPQRTKLHNLARLLRILGIGGSLNMITGELWGMALHRIPLEEDIVRCYIIGFSFIILLNEMEAVQMFRDSPVLFNWIPRGVLYSFLGIVGIVMNDIGNDQYFQNRMRKYNNYYNNQSAYTFLVPTTEQACEAYIRIGSVFVFLYGILYSVLGILRIQMYAKRHKEEYKQQLAAYNQHYGMSETGGCLV